MHRISFHKKRVELSDEFYSDKLLVALVKALLSNKNIPTTAPELFRLLKKHKLYDTTYAQMFSCITKHIKHEHPAIVRNARKEYYLSNLKIPTSLPSPEAEKRHPKPAKLQIKPQIVPSSPRLSSPTSPISLEQQISDTCKIRHLQLPSINIAQETDFGLGMVMSPVSPLHAPLEMNYVETMDPLELNEDPSPQLSAFPAGSSELSNPFLEFNQPLLQVPAEPSVDGAESDVSSDQDMDVFLDFSSEAKCANRYPTFATVESSFQDLLPSQVLLFERKGEGSDSPVYLTILNNKFYYVSWIGDFVREPLQRNVRKTANARYYIGYYRSTSMEPQHMAVLHLGPGCIPVLRSVADDSVNATTLLHAGGITCDQDKSVILSLERYRLRNPDISGTWIPLARAQALAQSCCLSDRLSSILSVHLEIDDFYIGLAHDLLLQSISATSNPTSRTSSLRRRQFKKTVT